MSVIYIWLPPFVQQLLNIDLYINWIRFFSLFFPDHFQTRLVHGILYLPGLREWKWVQDTSINYALHAIKD